MDTTLTKPYDYLHSVLNLEQEQLNSKYDLTTTINVIHIFIFGFLKLSNI